MQLCNVEIKQIRISGDNPRIINKKSEEFRELVSSIKSLGVKVPIHVRENPNGKSGYEMIAGERRLLAAGEVGLNTIPTINHGVLSDDTAFEVTFAENFAREDLTPLEQGKAVATLMVKYKGDVKAVASKMGKSVRWVMQRKSIHNNLSQLWRKAIIEDPDFKDFTASHLQMIAAMPRNVQDELFKYYDISYGEIPTVKELEKTISDRMRLLTKAPWNLDCSKLIEKVGACSKCSKRSSSQPGLFDDTDDAETIKKNDRCLDENCWNAKLKAHLEWKINELKATYPNLIYAVMPNDSFDYSERLELQERFGNVANEWKVSKEGAKDAIPALIVAGANAGELRWVIIKTTTSSGTTREVGADGKPKPKPLRERRAMLEKKRWFVVIRKLMEIIGESPVEKVISKDHVITVMALVVTFGTSKAYGDKGNWDDFKKLTKLPEVLTKLWESVRGTIRNNLSYCGPITQTPDHLIGDAKCTAQLLGIDIDAMFKEVSENDYPEPKSWAGLKADGTPKAAGPKKKNSKKAGKSKKAKS